MSYERGVFEACEALQEYAVRHGIVHAVQPHLAAKAIKAKLLPPNDTWLNQAIAYGYAEADGFVTLHPKVK